MKEKVSYWYNKVKQKIISKRYKIDTRSGSITIELPKCERPYYVKIEHNYVIIEHKNKNYTVK